MKFDNTGACTVISAIATVAELAPGTPLLAVAPAVENMPGPHSTRPGDVVRALNGKVVEITNTDAEGRLILGDAMVYAERLGATHLVDVATLTGAVGRALGYLVAGGFGTPQAWFDEVMRAAARGGERFWQLPLVDEYMGDLEGWYGEIVNSGTAEGSLVKSGLFLREFATVPWVHLDIAGTAYFRKVMPYAPRGATGISHATLVELALAGAAQSGGRWRGVEAAACARRTSPEPRRRPDVVVAGVVRERQLAGPAKAPARPARAAAARGPAPDPGRARHPRARLRGRRPRLGGHLGPDRRALAGARGRLDPSGRLAVRRHADRRRGRDVRPPAAVHRPRPPRPVRRLLPRPDPAARDGPRPAAAARRHHPAADPDHGRGRGHRDQPARRGSAAVRGRRRNRDPGPAVPALDPVRRRRDRDRGTSSCS